MWIVSVRSINDNIVRTREVLSLTSIAKILAFCDVDRCTSAHVVVSCNLEVPRQYVSVLQVTGALRYRLVGTRY